MSNTTDNGLLGNIQRFHLLQTERVETYSMFDEGFQAYLKGAPNYNFTMYKKLVSEITTTFQKISNDILGIEQMLLTNGRKDLADSIRKIQDLEEQKLKWTAELQMMQQKQTDEPHLDMAEALSEHNKKLATTVEEINDEMETLKYNSEDLYIAEET